MVTLAKRLKEAREMAGLSQSQVARRVGVEQSTYARYESGTRSPNPQLLSKIANVLGVSVDWLLGRSESPTPPVAPHSGLEGAVSIPVLGSIHAGDAAWAEQVPEGWLEVPAEILPGKGEYFALRVKGDCFGVGQNPIHDGYIVIVRRQPTVENGEIAVVYWPDQDEAVLRRVERKDGQVVLRADNPAYPVEVVRNRDLTILGKVVGFFGRPSAAKDVM